MTHRRRLSSTIGLALALVLATAPGASADTAADTATATAAEPFPQLAGPAPGQPSSTQLNAQVQWQQALLREQEARLAGAAAAATQALEEHQAAVRAAEQAQRTADAEARRLANARRATAEARENLSQYVGAMYRTGLGNRRLALYSGLMEARTPQRLLSGIGLVQRVGATQQDAVRALAQAEVAQRAAAVRATEARRRQEAAQQRAATAKARADAVVAQVKEQVLDRQLALLRTQAAAAAALAQEQRRADLLARAMVIARQRMNAPDTAVDGAFVPRPNATCKGRSTRGYQNGRIPEDALCPLWGTRGQMLRADAAAAFDDMSRAYAQEFGAPICVTDSYRSYEEQVAVAEEKPDLAAQPGTSNHGWGVATDLCDGIQSFGSRTHRWMQDNSMMFGWFLPAWAQQGGSKPEPWHWEFAG